jgi:hypothetical protein
LDLLGLPKSLLVRRGILPRACSRNYLLKVNDGAMTVVVPRPLGLSGSSSVEQWSWLESWILGSINWLLSLSFLDRLLFQVFLEHSGTSGETALHIVRHLRNAISSKGLPRKVPARIAKPPPSSKTRDGPARQGARLEVSHASGLVHKPDLALDASKATEH